jgi:lysophospholipase L1-like esterase
MRPSICVLLALCLGCAGAAQAQVPAIQDAPLRVMPIGDSITEGGDGAGGFRRPLFDLITAATGRQPNFVGGRNMRQSDPADFVDPDEDGYSAYRIEQITSGKGFWHAPSIEQRLRDWAPALVTLHAGTNDAQQDFYFDGNPKTGLPPVIDRLDDLVTRIVRYDPKIRIIVAQIVPANAPASATTQDYVVRLNALIPALVARHQAQGDRVSMVDMYTPMLAHPNPDGIHPDTAGYNVMANVWFAGIQALGVLPENPDPARFNGVHQQDLWSTESQMPWTLQPNLIRAGSPTLLSATTTDYTGGHSPALLNDGSQKAYTNDGDYPSTTTFMLNTVGAPNGYDITEVRTMAGRPIADNGDERAEQAYELWVQQADRPGTWTPMGAYHHVMVNRAQMASEVILSSTTPGAVMIPHVTAIQFRFVAPPFRQFGVFGILTQTPYRELEVAGVPSAP